MRYGTWNVRSLCRVGLIKSTVGELEKYMLNLVGVQEVRWEGVGYQIAENDIFFYGKKSVNYHLVTAILYIIESFQQLKGTSMLISECCI
jgi:hypothetical protein